MEASPVLAFVFLLFLTTSLPNSPVNGKFCDERVIPGIERMSRGVDITELDLTPTNLHTANGYRKTLIAFTCTQNRTWANPTSGEARYSRPDQISGVNTIPAGQISAVSEISGDSDDYKETWNVKLGLKVETVEYGAFSGSLSLKKLHENLYRLNQSVAETTASVSAIQVDFTSYQNLTPTADFLAYIPLVNGSPPTYGASPELYDELVDSYGTHYFESAIFGGFLYLRTEIAEEYLLDRDELDIGANLQYSFLELFKVDGEGDLKKHKVADHFRAHTKTELGYFGGTPPTFPGEHTTETEVPSLRGDSGTPELEGATDWMKDWLPTVNRDPWLFAGKLKPITRLIRNRAVRGEVAKAISLKMARAYLSEVRFILQSGSFRLTAQQESYLAKTESLLDARDHQALRQQLSQLQSILVFVTRLRDRARLAQVQANWNDFTLDIVACKTFIISLCVQSRALANRRDVLQAKEMTYKLERLQAEEGQGQLVEHAQVKALLAEARRLASYHRAPLSACPPGNHQVKCHNCLKFAANFAANHDKRHCPYCPFCRTAQAATVIGYTPVVSKLGTAFGSTNQTRDAKLEQLIQQIDAFLR